MPERVITIPDASELELTDQQARHLSFGLADIVREFLDQPGNREKFEAWKREKIANGDPYGFACDAGA